MKAQKPSGAGNPPNSDLGEEATEWLLRLEDTDPDPDDPLTDPVERQKEFLAWASRSPRHVAAFLEIAETYRRLGQADPQRLIDVRELLENRSAEVIRLYESQPRASAVSRV